MPEYEITWNSSTEAGADTFKEPADLHKQLPELIDFFKRFQVKSMDVVFEFGAKISIKKVES